MWVTNTDRSYEIRSDIRCENITTFEERLDDAATVRIRRQMRTDHRLPPRPMIEKPLLQLFPVLVL